MAAWKSSSHLQIICLMNSVPLRLAALEPSCRSMYTMTLRSAHPPAAPREGVMFIAKHLIQVIGKIETVWKTTVTAKLNH